MWARLRGCLCGSAEPWPPFARRSTPPLFLTYWGYRPFGSAEPLALDALLGTLTRASSVPVRTIAYNATGSPVCVGETPPRLVVANTLIAALLVVVGVLISRALRNRRRRTMRSGIRTAPNADERQRCPDRDARHDNRQLRIPAEDYRRDEHALLRNAGRARNRRQAGRRQATMVLNQPKPGGPIGRRTSTSSREANSMGCPTCT